jgi:transmembrane protein EpsG
MIFVLLYLSISIICLITNNGKKRIPRFLACAFFFLYIQALLGLRHINYAGVDTQVYARDFVRICTYNYSILDIFTYFFKDFGYYIFAKLVSLFTTNYNVFLFISALPYTYGITWLIYKYSKNIYLSMIIFLSYNFYLYNFQLMRHVFALGIIILAFKFLQENKIKAYFITVFIATFCHTIAIVFLLAFFLRKERISIKQILWVVCGCLVVLILSNQTILSLIFSNFSFLSSERFSQYETRGGTLNSGFIIQIGFVLISLYFMRYSNLDIYNENKDNEKLISGWKLHIHKGPFYPFKANMILLFNMATIAIIFYAMTSVIGEFYRLAQYLSIFAIILVPNSLAQAKDKKLALMVSFVLVLFGIRHFFGGFNVGIGVYNPYKFFWEGIQSLY